MKQLFITFLMLIHFIGSAQTFEQDYFKSKVDTLPGILTDSIGTAGWIWKQNFFTVDSFRLRYDTTKILLLCSNSKNEVYTITAFEVTLTKYNSIDWLNDGYIKEHVSWLYSSKAIIPPEIIIWQTRLVELTNDYKAEEIGPAKKKARQQTLSNITKSIWLRFALDVAKLALVKWVIK